MSYVHTYLEYSKGVQHSTHCWISFWISFVDLDYVFVDLIFQPLTPPQQVFATHLRHVKD